MGTVRLLWEGDDQRAGKLRLEEETPVRVAGEADTEVQQGVRNDMVILEGIKELRFTYLDPESDQEKWEESWDARERNRLPRAVRLDYRTEEGRKIQWVFPVMMTLLGP
jgi:hypothetical protein